MNYEKYYKSVLKTVHHSKKLIQSVSRPYLIYKSKKSVLDDYLTLGYTIADLLEIDDEKFQEVYYHTFAPIAQIAENIGFEPWKY